jgi:hypothetical protein
MSLSYTTGCGRVCSAFGSHVAQTLLTMAAASLGALAEADRSQLEETLQRLCRVVAQRADEVLQRRKSCES